MHASQNPYTPMLVTFNPERFFGRSEQIINILRVITASNPSGHAIYGIRTIGKSTLLKFIKDPRGATHHYGDYVAAPFRPGGGRHLCFVYLTYHRFTQREGTIFHKMLDELCEELVDDPQISTELDLPPVDPDTDRGLIIKQLTDLLHKLRDRYQTRVVFLMDDFDVPLIREFVDADDDGLLRTLSDDAALVIATDRPISFLRPDIGESSPLLGVLRPDDVGLLKDDEAHDLIRRPALEHDIPMSAHEEDFLLQVGGRQPFPLTAACELYFNMRLEYPDLPDMLHNDDDLDRLRNQFVFRLAGLPHVQKILEMVWEKLNIEEQQTLIQAAGDIKAALHGENPHVRELTTKSLMVYDLRRGTYKIYSELFNYFVQTRTDDAIDGPTLRIAVPSPSQIVNGLSPIDSALLEYFLANPDRVCTFDELLDAVWVDEDEKSKRALEAAVYRLRRTLGDSGNIKNVRGKGYKFVTADSVRGDRR